METIIKKVLGDENSFRALVAIQNSEQLQNILIWEYDVIKGCGYLREKTNQRGLEGGDIGL